VVPARYRSLLAVGGVPRLFAAGLLARLPVGIVPLALVLFVHARHHGAFALAGATAAAYGLAQGASSPLLGRIADRSGQGWLLSLAAVVNCAALVGVISAGLGGAPATLLVALAALAGAGRPPVSASVRRMLAGALGPSAELDSAYALESVLIEVFFILGPLIASGAAAAGSPAAALALAAASSLIGVLWLVSSPHARTPVDPQPAGGIAGALADPGIRTLLVISVISGLAFGALEVALPAFGARHGLAAAGGLGLAALSLASLCSGLIYGSRQFGGPVVNRYLVLSVLFALALIPVPLAWSIPSAVVLTALCGLFLAPAGACAFTLIDRLAPRGTLTEAFAWMTAANVAGAALGNALAGVVAARVGVHPALAIPAAAALFGAVIVLARREALGAVRSC
jgi:MFS family permease